MGLDTNQQRVQFIRNLPLSQRTGATFLQPSKKPNVEGSRIVDPSTGALGQSIFTRDFPNRKFIAIPRTTQLAASFQRLESPTEREFGKRQQVVMQQEAIKLRIKELEGKAKFRTGKAKRQLIARAKVLRGQSKAELARQQRISSRLEERRKDIAISTIRREQESLIKLLQRQGNRVVVNPSTGTIIATNIITGRRKIVTPSQIRTTLKGTIGVGGGRVEAKVPKGAKVDVSLIRTRRERKEGKARLKAEKEIRKEIRIEQDKQRRIKAIEDRSIKAAEKSADEGRLKFVPFEIGVGLSQSAKAAIIREQNRVKVALGQIPTIIPTIKKGVKPFIKKQIALFKEAKGNKQLVESAIRFLAHYSGFNFASEVGKGVKINLMAAYFDLAAKRKINLGSINRDSIAVLNSISKLNKKRKKGETITPSERQDLKNKFGKWRNTTKALRKKGAIADKEARFLFNKADANLARQVAALVVTVTILRGLGPTIKILTDVGLTVMGAVFSAKQGLETLKRPTAENWGKLGFFAMPTVLSILRVLRRFGPAFRPSVKNAPTMKNSLLNKLKTNEALLKQARKVKDKRAIRLIELQNKALKQAIKEMNWIINNPEIIKTRDFNPKIHTRNFKKLQGSYRDGIHVSTQPKARRLFGQKVTKLLSKKKIFKKIIEKAGKIEQPTKIGKLSTKTSLDRLILRGFKRNKVIVGGGRALNLLVKRTKRRFTSDIDGKVTRNAKGILQSIAREANKLFGKNRFIVRTGTHKGTFKLIDKISGRTLIDLTNISKKIPFVLNPQGLRVETKISLLLGKADSLSKLQRFIRKGKLDIGDVARLTGRKIKAKEILVKHKNPSNTFEVVKQVKGMGRDRIAFDETHMYFDFEAPVAYSQGKPFSIIKFPKTKLFKFPPNLRKLINKASKGQLSTSQSNNLRRALNRHIKANPNKFFISPRTASLPIGEREIALAETSKFIKTNVYKTFDNDLKTFVSVIEVAFDKTKKLSLARKFINGWKRNPFRTLKLRLTNPDVLTVRKYARIVERDIKLKSQQVNIFLRIFNKVIRPVGRAIKGVVTLTKKQIFKLKIQRRVLQRKIKRLGDTKVEIRLKDELRIKLRRIESKLGIIRKVEKVVKPIKIAVRKGKRIVRISGEAISTTNARVITNVKTTIGNIGIKVSFTKVNTRAKIRNISRPVSRRLNILTLKLKRQIRISKNKITRPIIITLNKIKRILGNLNIKMKFAKIKVGQKLKGKVAKVRVPIRKGVRVVKITKERLNVSTRKFIRKTETSLGNVNIRLKFAKFRTKERVSNISLSVQRKVNIRILRMKRRIRISKANINAIIRRGVNGINNLLKKFNYKIKVETIRVKAVVKVTLRKTIRPTKRILVISKERISSINSRVINSTKNKLGSLGIRVNFVKLRTKIRIKNISLDVQRTINTNILLIRRALRKSGNRITQPIISRVNIIQNSLKRFNIKLRVTKLKIGTRIGKIKKAVTKVKGLIKISGERLSTINSRVVTNVKTKLGNMGIKASFIKVNVKARIRNITSISRRRINTNILLIRRALRKRGNRITRPIISKLNTIKRLFKNFNIRLKFIKFKVGQRITPVKAAVIRVAKKPVRVIKRTQLKIFNRINKTVNGINRTIGNLGIRIKFKKAQLRGKISGLTTPVERLINRNLRLIKRELIKSKGRMNNRIRLLIKRIKKLIPIEIEIKRPGVKKKVPISKRIKFKKEVKKPTTTLKRVLKEPNKITDSNRLIKLEIRKRRRLIKKPTLRKVVKTAVKARLVRKVKVRKRVRVPKRKRVKTRIRKRTVIRKRVRPRVRKPVRVRVPIRIRKRVSVRKRVRVPVRARVRVPVRVRPRVRKRIFIVPRVPKIILPPDVEKVKQLRKLSGKVIQSQPFIYLRDMYSAIYGIVANPAEKKVFLRVGRIFKGFERRKIIKGKR